MRLLVLACALSRTLRRARYEGVNLDSKNVFGLAAPGAVVPWQGLIEHYDHSMRFVRVRSGVRSEDCRLEQVGFNAFRNGRLMGNSQVRVYSLAPEVIVALRVSHGL